MHHDQQQVVTNDINLQWVVKCLILGLNHVQELQLSKIEKL